jgi:hypothetical protein
MLLFDAAPPSVLVEKRRRGDLDGPSGLHLAILIKKTDDLILQYLIILSILLCTMASK